IECRCPYSARKLLCERESLWYALPTHTPEALETLLRGVYGRCVYACENDAVDHQVVNLLFEGGVTVSHSMEAYTWERDRQTRICCTRGEIIGDARTLTIHHFDSRTTEQWDAALESGTATHESSYILGNDGLMRDWVEAMRTLPPTAYVERFHESIQSHALAFAAEYSRLNGGAPVPIASL
ncbi:MAG: gfo/Idh/MocA family oxidoreductase, partial [Kiritimatiellia bacterium]